MMYMVVDDGQQPMLYVCSSDAEMKAVALPADAKGHKLYGFPSEELARGGFPNLVLASLPKSPSGCGKAAVLLLLLGGLGLAAPALTSAALAIF